MIDELAAQGDGEASGTAIECPVGAQLTLDVRDHLAARIAVDGMLDLLERERLARDDALAATEE